MSVTEIIVYNLVSAQAYNRQMVGFCTQLLNFSLFVKWFVIALTALTVFDDFSPSEHKANPCSVAG